MPEAAHVFAISITVVAITRVEVWVWGFSVTMCGLAGCERLWVVFHISSSSWAEHVLDLKAVYIGTIAINGVYVSILLGHIDSLNSFIVWCRKRLHKGGGNKGW